MTFPLSDYDNIPQVYKCKQCAEKDAEIIRLKDEILRLKAKEIPLKEPFKIIHEHPEWKKG